MDSFEFLPLVYKAIEEAECAEETKDPNRNARLLVEKFKKATEYVDSIKSVDLTVQELKDILDFKLKTLKVKRERRQKYLKAPIFIVK